MQPDKAATCQYCLADSRYTAISANADRRCPVCGSDYTGPRRNKEFNVLLKVGLVADDE